LARQRQESILLAKYQEKDDDTDTVVGIDYTDEEYEHTEYDYNSVPLENNVGIDEINIGSEAFRDSRYL
jgi:hypothetical protein